MAAEGVGLDRRSHPLLRRADVLAEDRAVGRRQDVRGAVREEGAGRAAVQVDAVVAGPGVGQRVQGAVAPRAALLPHALVVHVQRRRPVVGALGLVHGEQALAARDVQAQELAVVVGHQGAGHGGEHDVHGQGVARRDQAEAVLGRERLGVGLVGVPGLVDGRHPAGAGRVLDHQVVGRQQLAGVPIPARRPQPQAQIPGPVPQEVGVGRGADGAHHAGADLLLHLPPVGGLEAEVERVLDRLDGLGVGGEGLPLVVAGAAAAEVEQHALVGEGRVVLADGVPGVAEGRLLGALGLEAGVEARARAGVDLGPVEEPVPVRVQALDRHERGGQLGAEGGVPVQLEQQVAAVVVAGGRARGGVAGAALRRAGDAGRGVGVGGAEALGPHVGASQGWGRQEQDGEEQHPEGQDVEEQGGGEQAHHSGFVAPMGAQMPMKPASKHSWSKGHSDWPGWQSRAQTG